MLLCSNRIRLSDRDRKLLVWASQGSSVDEIKRVDQLVDFIHATQQLYPGHSAEERRIRILLQRFIPDAGMVRTEGNVLRLIHF
ncbi:MAG: hypothetical protein K9M17_01970 [Mariprofundaceae bacterium]|nr:hypothetical protein [Mariprofundaceae bacterium]